MSKIDIDKFISSMIHHSMLDGVIEKCLKEQGLEYKNGEISQTNEKDMAHEIDIEKFICSCIQAAENSIATDCLSEVLDGHIFKGALKEQGLEYKNGKIQKIDDKFDKYDGNEMHFLKFKPGDWVICIDGKYGPIHIKSINEKDKCYETDGGFLSFDLEFIYRHWRIEDAQPGDVLANKYGDYLIFKQIMRDNSILAHCMYSDETKTFYCAESSYSSNYLPATDEQKKYLFSMMKIAGYEWDEDIKTVKRISFWTDKEIEQLEKETNEGTDKLKELLKNIVLQKPDLDAMVDEFTKQAQETLKGFYIVHDSAIAQRAYRKGLEDMYEKLKES